MSSSRRRRPTAHVNHERWMVSFADFMTLLFALFVVLFSISTVDEQKLEKVAESMDQAFGLFNAQGPNLLNTPAQPNQPIPPIVQPQSPAPPVTSASDQKLMKRLEAVVRQTQGLPATVSLRQENRGVVIQLRDTRLFASGSADLRPEIQAELRRIGRELKAIGQPVRIEGHTDNVPVRGITGGFRSNWELSAARANRVLQFFLEMGALPPDRFSVAGYGEYRPIAPNGSESGRARNRRVDIVILNPQAAQAEPPPPPADNAAGALDQQMNQQLQKRRS
ncbi:MAG: flagellar motor protein MotB [Candidatus Sericytochromatia bacterium]